MEFTSYRDRTVALAVDLVNSPTEELDALLERHEVQRRGRATRRDVEGVEALRNRLRVIFESDEPRAVEALNHLLSQTGARPRLVEHDPEGWHLHFASEDQPLAERLGAYAAMGLATVVAEGGLERLKVCHGDGCRDVFVDLSKNRSRRFCSPEVCGNRASVAAYRRRRREAREAAG